MKKIVFYIEPEWAFGTIHTELTKQLFVYGINSFVLPWNRCYTKQEMLELSDNIDYFVSTPHGLGGLFYHFDIPPEKCIAICHSASDLVNYKELGENVNRLHNFAVVSKWLDDKSLDLEIEKIPKIVNMGINFDTFYSPISTELKTVGYAGSFNFRHIEIKRGWLAEKVVAESGLDFKIAEYYHNSFVTMAGFYKTVDAILISSTEEGAGLPALEAGAAGKLVISTPVGLWNTKITDTGGISVSIDEADFIDESLHTLNFYKKMPKEYRNKCLQIQEHAKSYDWKYVIQEWVDLLSN
jgi:glycosyltransferase involved in cell wall biosynthesis